MPPRCEANATTAPSRASESHPAATRCTHSRGGRRSPAPRFGALSGSFGSLGIKAGDLLTLKAQGASTVLSVLKVGTLHADSSVHGLPAISCGAGQWF